MSLSAPSGSKADLKHAVERGLGDDSFGFERYRFELWGSDAVRSTGATILPRLGEPADVFVRGSAELDQLEWEAVILFDRADEIAAQVFDAENPGAGAVAVRFPDGTGELRNAFGGGEPADSIRRYTSNLLRYIAAAREHDFGLWIW